MTPTSEVVGVCTCQACLRPYETDMLVPDDVWEAIKPDGCDIGAGLLCPTCIMDRASDRLGWSVGFVYPERHGDAVTAGKSSAQYISWLLAERAASLTPESIEDKVEAMTKVSLISTFNDGMNDHRLAPTIENATDLLRWANGHIFRLSWSHAQETNARLTAERLLAEAREALKPWAVIADAVLSEAPHDATKAKLWNGVDNSPLFISLDACRRIIAARASIGGVNG
jgi:hypothetical protein